MAHCASRSLTEVTQHRAASAIAAGIVVFWHGIAGIRRFTLFSYLFLSTASHGLLDAMTNGGLGVAFFSPFDNTRYFLPWRPIRVSPIGVPRFFTPRGFRFLQSELLWIWVPATLFALVIWTLRRKGRIGQADANQLDGIPLP